MEASGANVVSSTSQRLYYKSGTESERSELEFHFYNTTV
jgi:hypothetical protein